MSDQFSAAAWDERYRSRDALWSGKPNLYLVSEADGLAPGLALDAGAGEGADAIWLAAQGWRVVAIDISAVALERAAAHAAGRGEDLASRIDWRREDLASLVPAAATFDLVTAQYLQLPPAARTVVFGALAGAVAPGGTLLIVGHHPSDLQTTMPRPRLSEVFYTGDDIAALLGIGLGTGLGTGEWDIVTNAAPGRKTTDPDGNAVTIHDTVFRAVRRAPG